jgi:CheY-like chemotaxis protein
MNVDSDILPFRVWIADDDDDFREALGKSLAQEKRSIRLFANGEELIEALKRDSSFDIIIADLLMPVVDGLQVLEKARKSNPDGVVIIMTGYASLDTAIQAIRGGAYDYIRKPFKLDELEVIVKNAGEKIALIRENRRLLQKLKDAMEEMKGIKEPSPEIHPPVESVPSLALDHRITEMGVILNQLIPPDYGFKEREQRGRTFQELQKLIEYKRQGFLSETEFVSLKKILLQSFQD